MEKFWSYIVTLFAGVIAGLLIFLKLKDPDQVINDNTQIGKMKQRGQGNDATITIDPKHIADDSVNVKTREEKREERKANRIAKRAERRAERQEVSL
ncbi:MAG TPA: hypothetical protein VFC67_21030 [Prolixibacteraceae bacterium]|nr:hypothetical protein [Prolixibacteraceae bacterium]